MASTTGARLHNRNLAGGTALCLLLWIAQLAPVAAAAAAGASIAATTLVVQAFVIVAAVVLLILTPLEPSVGPLS